MLKKYFRMKIFTIFTFVCSSIVCETKHPRKNPAIEARIVGGKSVALEKYPFAVQFYNLGALCGGVILNTWSILTSAHCFEINKDIDEMRVQIGSKYIYDFNAKRYDIDYFVTHEQYSKIIPFENDIAMVFVKKPMKFNKAAKKGILINHNKWMSPQETRFTVTGWGMIKYGGDLSHLSLMMTSLSYVPIKECSRLHKIKMSEDMFCLYGDGQRDTCKGDSGGGVLWHGRLVGLTSHGDGCAKKNKPSVYTNLWYHSNWIKKQVQNFIDNYCNKENEEVIRERINTINNTLKYFLDFYYDVSDSMLSRDLSEESVLDTQYFSKNLLVLSIIHLRTK